MPDRSSKYGGNAPLCYQCQKRVYHAEHHLIGERAYHRDTCIKCVTCKRLLNVLTYVVVNNRIYCRPHAFSAQQRNKSDPDLSASVKAFSPKNGSTVENHLEESSSSLASLTPSVCELPSGFEAGDCGRCGKATGGQYCPMCSMYICDGCSDAVHVGPLLVHVDDKALIERVASMPENALRKLTALLLSDGGQVVAALTRQFICGSQADGEAPQWAEAAAGRRKSRSEERADAAMADLFDLGVTDLDISSSSGDSAVVVARSPNASTSAPTQAHPALGKSTATDGVPPDPPPRPRSARTTTPPSRPAPPPPPRKDVPPPGDDDGSDSGDSCAVITTGAQHNQQHPALGGGRNDIDDGSNSGDSCAVIDTAESGGWQQHPALGQEGDGDSDSGDSCAVIESPVADKGDRQQLHPALAGKGRKEKEEEAPPPPPPRGRRFTGSGTLIRPKTTLRGRRFTGNGTLMRPKGGKKTGLTIKGTDYHHLSLQELESRLNRVAIQHSSAVMEVHTKYEKLRHAVQAQLQTRMEQERPARPPGMYKSASNPKMGGDHNPAIHMLNKMYPI